MTLDLSSLTNAIFALEKSIQSHQHLSQNPALTAADMETVKSGVIQNFEVAYEQCWKFMRRWMELNLSPEAADGITRRELFRLSAENRLINDVDLWMEFHAARNLTAHTYDLRNAEKSFQAALAFLPAAQDFLRRLEVRND